MFPWIMTQIQLVRAMRRSRRFAHQSRQTYAERYVIDVDRGPRGTELSVGIMLRLGARVTYLDIGGTPGPLTWIRCPGARSMKQVSDWVRIDFGARDIEAAYVTYRVRVEPQRNSRWLSLPDCLAQPVGACARHPSLANMPLPALELRANSGASDVAGYLAVANDTTRHRWPVLHAIVDSRAQSDLTTTPSAGFTLSDELRGAAAASATRLEEELALLTAVAAGFLPHRLHANWLFGTLPEIAPLLQFAGDSGVLVPIASDGSDKRLPIAQPAHWKTAALLFRGLFARALTPVGPFSKEIEEGLSLAFAWRYLESTGERRLAANLLDAWSHLASRSAPAGWWNRVRGYPSAAGSSRVAIALIQATTAAGSWEAVDAVVDASVGKYTDAAALLAGSDPDGVSSIRA